MYSIKDYSYDRAKKLDVKIRPSKKGFSKIDVFKNNGDYITSIGDNRYYDYPTYLAEKGEAYALKRRSLYHIRHKKDKSERGFYALYILW